MANSLAMATTIMTSNNQPKLHISVQHNNFNVAELHTLLAQSSRNTGAVVTFTGLVRDSNLGTNISGLHLEHYPGMTEKVLRDIALEAHTRWPFIALQIIHRVGELQPTDQIVFVGVSSTHRSNAFHACEFIMDFLKTKAPFWKKELNTDGSSRWLDARETDQKASERWQTGTTENN